VGERALTLRKLNRATCSRSSTGSVVLEPFAALPRSVHRELEDEAGRLEAFLAD
jgi:hypothetical protein